MVSGPVLLPTDLTIINSTDWDPKDYLIHPPNIQVPQNLITFPTASALPHWSPSTLHLRWHTDDRSHSDGDDGDGGDGIGGDGDEGDEDGGDSDDSDGDYDDGGDGDG